VRPGILHAYDAQNVTNELWNSEQLSARDSVGSFAKFVPPTVANGKVYLATFSSRLNVYGLLSSTSSPRLTVSPSSLDFGSVGTGQNSSLSFHITNSGGMTLSGTASTASPFAITADNSFSLGSGQSSVVQVGFAPTSAGNFSNVVIFASNGGNSTNSVTGVGASLPLAAFTANPTVGSYPLGVLFSDNSTGSITNRAWDFGDNSKTNTTGTTVSHTYTTAGTNTVSLTVSGPFGTDTLTQPAYITVTNLGPVTLSFQPVGKELQLSWPAGILQSAAQVTGPYTNLPGTASPYSVTPSNVAQFFRIKVQ
jgi:PKD repeat protein